MYLVRPSLWVSCLDSGDDTPYSLLGSRYSEGILYHVLNVWLLVAGQGGVGGRIGYSVPSADGIGS